MPVYCQYFTSFLHTILQSWKLSFHFCILPWLTGNTFPSDPSFPLFSVFFFWLYTFYLGVYFCFHDICCHPCDVWKLLCPALSHLPVPFLKCWDNLHDAEKISMLSNSSSLRLKCAKSMFSLCIQTLGLFQFARCN